MVAAPLIRFQFFRNIFLIIMYKTNFSLKHFVTRTFYSRTTKYYIYRHEDGKRLEWLIAGDSGDSVDSGDDPNGNALLQVLLYASNCSYSYPFSYDTRYHKHFQL
jgi:hypothetical protein